MAAATTSASAPTWPGWSCKLIFEEMLERIPDMHLVGRAEILRSNFIGGVKHMPVEYTPGTRRGTDEV